MGQHPPGGTGWIGHSAEHHDQQITAHSTDDIEAVSVGGATHSFTSIVRS